MQGGFFPAAACMLLGISCGGATTSDPGVEPQPEPEPTSATPRCDCVPATIRWWRAGELVEAPREASLEPCAVFGYREVSAEPGSNRHCGSTLQGCGDALGVDDVSTALAHPDVQAALARAPVVFGRDLRPLDGHIDHVEVNGKVIEIGDPCAADDPDCSLPLGIDRFGRLLGNLQFQELASASCKVK